MREGAHRKSPERGRGFSDVAWCRIRTGTIRKANLGEAFKWLSQSAEHGNPDAQVALGGLYEFGRGVSQNYQLAA